MNELINSIIEKLSEIEKYISEKDVQKWIDDNYSQSLPIITVGMLSNIPRVLKQKINCADTRVLDEQCNGALENILTSLNHCIGDILPNMFTSSYHHGYTHAIYIYLTTLSSIDFELSNLFGWCSLDENQSLVPRSIKTRLKSINAQIEKITPDYEDLKNKIDVIRDARDSAEKLPIVLDELKEAQNIIKTFSQEAEKASTDTKNLFLQSETYISEIEKLKIDAQDLIQRADLALKGSTSVALAKSFTEQEINLKNSIRWWTAFLALALLLILIIAVWRASDLSLLLKDNKYEIKWSLLWIQASVTFLLISGPVWFAWIATKQIKQRFKLQQDYSFKAAAATAYEGYSREASQFDNETAQRLFNAALTRLEESPIRLVDDDPHNTPWEEILQKFSKEKMKFPKQNVEKNYKNSQSRSLNNIETSEINNEITDERDE